MKIRYLLYLQDRHKMWGVITQKLMACAQF